MRQFKLLAAVLALSALTACATVGMGVAQPPEAASLVSPTPIQGTTGKYLSPFTSDGVTAGWVTKSMQVSAGGSIGQFAGQQAGQRLMQNVPFVGGMLGENAGKALGRKIALDAIGGEAFMKSSTDLSFNSPNDLAVYMYANHSTHPEYAKILAATKAIYPELETTYEAAIAAAPRKAAQ
jgi:hypothetical protein